MKTVDTCFPSGESDEKKLKHHLQSKALQQLSKAGSHEGRFAALMNENFKEGCDLETYAPQYSWLLGLIFFQLHLFDPADAERGTSLRL